MKFTHFKLDCSGEMIFLYEVVTNTSVKKYYKCCNCGYKCSI